MSLESLDSLERKKGLEMDSRPIKITVVGDRIVGKTCLLISYVQNSFPEILPTVFHNNTKTVEVDGVNFSLNLWDTAGQEEYDRLRPLSYPKTDCFLLCYDINNRSSFANIEHKWIPEVRHYCPKSAIILVGIKSDLRETTDPTHTVTEAEGNEMKAKIKANGFVQCSAKTRDNLDSVFIEAVRATTSKDHQPKTCKIL